MFGERRSRFETGSTLLERVSALFVPACNLVQKLNYPFFAFLHAFPLA
jgi:hypothetical protein